MKRFFALLIAIFTLLTASAQEGYSIILDQSSFRAVQTDALTGVNIDPIAQDKSRNACARLKIRFANMNRAEVDALEIKFRSNTDIARQTVAQYFDNVLILEVTAKPFTRFFVQSSEFGQSNEVTINLEANREYEMEARLNQVFSIVVNSNIEGAEVYIDNNFKGRTSENFNLTIPEVVIGPHILKVSYGGVSSQQNINVNKNSILFRQNVDTAASEPQYVVFEVEPKNAVVMIDNQPHTLQEGAMMIVLPSGTYNYTISAAGYHSESSSFTVAGSKVEKRISLRADNATVTLTAPNNAEILINGNKRGVGSWSGTLASGTYIFESYKAGHRNGKLTKTISSTPASQSYTLPAPTPVTGALTITSVPLMADVALDGMPVGRTPLDLKEVLTGGHLVTISKAGYNTYTQTVAVAEDKTTTLNATLSKLTTTTATTTTTAQAATPNIDMVYVKGGTFTMGGTAEQGADAEVVEKPAHSVTLSGFYIGKYEVTQAQWKAIMGTNPSNWKGDNLPVENVSWNDVQEFISKLNVQTGKKYRLPTEAEWEYAARGGNQSKGCKYSGSNSISNIAWYDANSNKMTHIVGQKSPNELGIYDMSGNVCEWCQDLFGMYSSSSQTNPTGPSSGLARMVRGGCWVTSEDGCRVSYRCNYNQNSRYSFCGFRLALSADNNVSSNTSTISTAKTYKIGDIVTINGVKGIIFQTSPMVKIVSIEETTAAWSTGYGDATHICNTSNGKENLKKIKAISGWQTKYPAFKWCADLGDGWYLPSIKELQAIYTQSEKINNTLSTNNMGKLGSKSSSLWLWSSCEDTSLDACYVDLSCGTYSRAYKSCGFAVRAVRVVTGEDIPALAVNKTYKVGDYYNENGKEGVVFEVTADGKHGKIVSMTQSDRGIRWASDVYEQKRLIGADSKSDGAYNMAKVKSISGWQTKYPAFKWCADLGDGWYLPAIDELEKFMLDKSVWIAVSRTLIASGGTALHNVAASTVNRYWSSTEYAYQYGGIFYACNIYMKDGTVVKNPKNTGGEYSYTFVRAVATF